MAALRKSDTPSVGELTYYEARKQQRLLPQREYNSCVYHERWLWSYFVNLEAANVVGLCLASVLTLTSYEDECFHFSLCTILKCFISTLHSSFDIFRNTNIALFTKSGLPQIVKYSLICLKTPKFVNKLNQKKPKITVFAAKITYLAMGLVCTCP